MPDVLHRMSATAVPRVVAAASVVPSVSPSPAAVAAVGAPMTREQWLAEQARVREEYDPDTGRMRLVRGSGEIIERVVSKDRHAAINKLSTIMDGRAFQRGR